MTIKIKRAAPNAVWSPQMDQRMVDLLAAGNSAREVANAISAEFKVALTRNAVLGRLYRHKDRLGIDRTDNREAQRAIQTDMAAVKKARKAKAAAKVKAVIEEAPRPAPMIFATTEPAATSRTLVDMSRHHCRWPVGLATGADQMFCCATATEESRYCEAHLKASRSGVKLKKLRVYDPRVITLRARAA